MTEPAAFRSLIDGFVQSVNRFPLREALVVDGERLTYLTLQRLAGKIASTILQHEQDGFPLVGLLAHRSKTAYAGVLGILGAGKGYVPLNPKFPIERTRRMLALSGCGMLIAGREGFRHLPELLMDAGRPLTVILPDAFDAGDLSSDFPQHRFVSSQKMTGGDAFSSGITANPARIAYLLFTSGSTGQPKGVPIPQSNVRSYVQHVCDRYDVNETDRFSQEFDLTFDLSDHDMFVCWERGACLFSVPEKSVLAPAKFIREHRLTMWFSVPSVIGLLVRMRLLSPGCFPSLRYSLFCGEPLSASYAQRWQEAAPNSILENLYGPTETTIAISHYRWNKSGSLEAECVNGIVPIGWIFDGQACRVIDADRKAVSAGVPGELCLCGSQVTTGYWNDPARTQEQFVRLPGAGEDLWYRTGDMVQQSADGCLYYLGRMDHQVKVRGYRVELQEIEAVLRKACGTEQVVAIAWPVENGSADGIVAFVSGAGGFDHDRVLDYCGRVLPGYMVPRKLYLCDEFPLNANGKIDRARLVCILTGREK
ncbi:MAG: amino acid adenylation domain-containing protein [Verrucomicrobia bacterium]|nr:amino acid adenylation domain-containing protein [Verrucomicrobiota bacterium]